MMLMSRIKSKYLFRIILLILFLLFILSILNTIKEINESENICNIKIENSYSIWHPQKMKSLIQIKLIDKYDNADAVYVLNRNYKSIYIEWWLHNIGYYVTKPFCFIDYVYGINLRCKDVDIEKWE